MQAYKRSKTPVTLRDLRTGKILFKEIRRPTTCGKINTVPSRTLACLRIVRLTSTDLCAVHSNYRNYSKTACRFEELDEVSQALIAMTSQRGLSTNQLRNQKFLSLLFS